MNHNVKVYFDSTGLSGYIRGRKRYPTGRLGNLLFRLETKFITWLICGFRYVKDENVKGGRTWNDDYHLLSKLCRYETWKDIKITWWDKIRFRLITSQQFK